jgi:ketosteroid isomerase-like protein
VPTEEADIDLVRTAFDAFAVSRDGIDEYFRRFFTPDGVIEFVDGFPLPGRYEGLDGYKRFFDESYGPYEDIRRRLDSIVVEGGTIVALLTITGRERGADVELQVQMGNTYELQDGRIKHMRVYLGHERTVEAARAGG